MANMFKDNPTTGIIILCILICGSLWSIVRSVLHLGGKSKKAALSFSDRTKVKQVTKWYLNNHLTDIESQVKDSRPKEYIINRIIIEDIKDVFDLKEDVLTQVADNIYRKVLKGK